MEALELDDLSCKFQFDAFSWAFQEDTIDCVCPPETLNYSELWRLDWTEGMVLCFMDFCEDYFWFDSIFYLVWEFVLEALVFTLWLSLFYGND